MKAFLYVVLYPTMVISGLLGVCWAVIVLPVHASRLTIKMIDKITSEVDTL